MKNLKKDVRPGTARLADGAKLFDPADDSHVRKTTPLEIKIKQHCAAEDLGIDPKREKSASRKRADKETRPL